MQSIRHEWFSNVRNDLLAGLGIIYLFPYITRAIPSPLVAIVTLTPVSIGFGLDIRTVGDMGQLPDSLPVFLLPDIPLTLETLRVIFPVALTLAVVGLLESMMTASIVDELTDSPSNKNRECVGRRTSVRAPGCAIDVAFKGTRLRKRHRQIYLVMRGSKIHSGRCTFKPRPAFLAGRVRQNTDFTPSQSLQERPGFTHLNCQLAFPEVSAVHDDTDLYKHAAGSG